MPRLTSLAVAKQVFSDKDSAQNFLCTQLLQCAKITKSRQTPKVLLPIQKENKKPALQRNAAKSNLAIWVREQVWGKRFDSRARFNRDYIGSCSGGARELVWRRWRGSFILSLFGAEGFSGRGWRGRGRFLLGGGPCCGTSPAGHSVGGECLLQHLAVFASVTDPELS